MPSTSKILLISSKNDLVFSIRNLLQQKKIHVTFSEKLLLKSAPNVDYVVFVMSSMFEKHFSRTNYFKDKLRINAVKKIIDKDRIKAVFVFPYVLPNSWYLKISPLIDVVFNKYQKLASFIFLGNFLFPDKITFGKGLINGIFHKIFSRNLTSLTGSFKFYPLTTEESSQSVIKSIFSMKYYGAKTAFLGKALGVEKIRKDLSKKIGKRNLSLLYASGLIEQDVEEKISLDRKKNVSNKIIKKLYLLPNNAFIFRLSFKKALGAIFVLFITIPFWVFLISFLLLFGTQALFSRGWIEEAFVFSKASTPFFYILNKTSTCCNIVPLDELRGPRNILLKGYEVVNKKIILAENLNSVYLKLVGKKDSDNVENFNDIKINLQSISEGLGYIQGEQKSSNYLSKRLSGLLWPDGISEERNMVFGLISLSDYLPEMLGKNSVKKYLILIESPKYPRPSGGKVLKAVVYTISKEKIVDVNILDPKNGLENIRGFAEVPGKLDKYVGGSWNLETYNLSPDFATSAKKAMIFLDKQFDLSVNAVVSVNISDTELSNISINNKKEFYKNSVFFLDNLEKRNIQVYFDSEILNNVVDKLEFLGNIKEPICNNFCIPDFMGFFEISGGNNHMIKKEFNLKIKIEEALIKRDLKVIYQNLGELPYVGQFNLMVPETSGFSPITIANDGDKIISNPLTYGLENFKVASTELKISPFSSTTVKFYWETPLNSNQNYLKYYNLLIRKPSGDVGSVINLNVLENNFRGNEFGFVLTDGGELRYNTILTRDTLFKINLD